MKKGIIIIIFAIIIITVGVLLTVLEEKPTKKANIYDDKVNKIIEKLDNKESFNLFLYSRNEESGLVDVLNYYKKVFSIEFDKLEINFSNEAFKSLVNRLDIDIVDSDETAFIIIDNGIVDSSINGVFSETSLRRQLIKANIIGPEYNHIDYLANDDDFKKYYASNKMFNILYINNNSDSYKYRELLLKNKVNSLVIYFGELDSDETSTMLEHELNLEDDSTKKLPILIKTQNHKIISAKYNISLEEFATEIK